MPVIKKAAAPPKIRNAGRHKEGAWLGHAAEAAEVKDADGEWCLLLKGVSRDRAASPAGAINRGDAADFKPDFDGNYKAVTRRNEADETTYDLWVCYVKTGPKSTASKVKPPGRRRSGSSA